MLTQDQIANYSDRALMLAIYKDFSSRLDTLQSTMTNGISNLSTAVQTIAKTQGDIMTAVSDLQAAIAAEDNEIAAAVTYIQGVPALVAAAVLAAQQGNDTALATITADVNAQAAAVAAALAPAALAPAAPPPAAPASPAP